MEKTAPTVTASRWRAAKDERGRAVFDVSRDKIRKGPKGLRGIMADKHTGHRKLRGARYDHVTAGHTEGECAPDPHGTQPPMRQTGNRRDISKWNGGFMAMSEALPDIPAAAFHDRHH